MYNLSLSHGSSHQLTALAKEDKCPVNMESPTLSLGQCNCPESTQYLGSCVTCTKDVSKPKVEHEQPFHQGAFTLQ